MACQITITSIDGISGATGFSPIRIEVHGTVEGCKQLTVTINDDGPVVVDVAEDETAWTAVFSGIDFDPADYACGKMDIKVHAACTDGECEADLNVEELDCKPEEGKCPTGGIEVVVDPGTQDCEDGSRHAVLRFTVTAPGSLTVASLDFGDGAGFSQPIVADGNQTVTSPDIGHDYDAPAPGEDAAEYTPQITFTIPAGCDPIPLVPPLSVPACEPDPGPEPQPEPEPDCRDLEVTDILISEGRCDGRLRLMRATAQTSGSPDPTSYEWEWSDGFEETTGGPSSLHQMDAAATSEASVAVLVTWPNGCTDLATTPFTVRVCADDGGGGGEDGGGGSGDADDDDGGGGGGGGGGGFSLCELLRLAGLALLIIGMVLVFAGACSSNVPIAVVGAVIALIGAGLLVTWALVCAPQEGGCLLLQRLIELLSFLTIILTILAIIFGILAIFEIGIPCLIGTIIDLGIAGTLLSILILIFEGLGCQFAAPSLFGVRRANRR